MEQFLLLSLFVVVAGISGYWGYATLSRRVLVGRMQQQDASPAADIAPESGLGLWMRQAGYRDPAAVSRFALSCVIAAAIGLFLAVTSSRSVPRLWIAQWADSAPIGLGVAAETFSLLLPVILGLFVVLIPYTVVQSRRDRRRQEMGRDLPVTLELLATLAEAGLAMDASLARIRETSAVESELQFEFEVYQRDILAGIPRAQAMRRMARRCNLPAFDAFVASMIQAELAGASLSDTLRRQADDLRDRRKMQALLHSQALPVKLVGLLLICFLPGLFVATLGPTLQQLVKIVGGAVRHHR